MVDYDFYMNVYYGRLLKDDDSSNLYTGESL